MGYCRFPSDNDTQVPTHMGHYGLGGRFQICPLFSQERASLLRRCGMELGEPGEEPFYIHKVEMSVGGGWFSVS